MALDWTAQQVRLSVFSNAPIAASERDWQAITGQEEAESRTTIPGGRLYGGPFADGYLAFSYSGQRLDLVLSGVVPAENTDGRPPIIGPWPVVCESFSANVEKWLPGIQFPVLRVAVGAVLLVPTNSRDEAYTHLGNLLTSVKVDPAMKELSFQINWAKESTAVNGLILNRITNWSAARIIQRIVQITGEQLAVTPNSELYAVRLEIDNSTDQANTKPFEKAEIVPIFKELILMARENAEKGERP
jgi:hypothetical protein